jgi:hypothetical protein
MQDRLPQPGAAVEVSVDGGVEGVEDGEAAVDCSEDALDLLAGEISTGDASTFEKLRHFAHQGKHTTNLASINTMRPAERHASLVIPPTTSAMPPMLARHQPSESAAPVIGGAFASAYLPRALPASHVGLR